MNIPLYLPHGELPEHLAHLSAYARSGDNLLGDDLPSNDLSTAATQKQPDGLCLIYQDNVLGLKDFSEPKVGAVVVDFTSDAMQYRAKGFNKGQGSIKNEAIGKALGIKGGQTPRIIDATAGLGRDGFMLMTLGAEVTLLERSEVVAALLVDGIHRATHSGLMMDDFSSRFKFKSGQAADLLRNWQDDTLNTAPLNSETLNTETLNTNRPDAIYLDPMFPHKKKSALVKKEMRLFQQLLGPDEDADVLLAPALALAKKRVVVKRPDYAPFLANTEPSMQIKSKKHRFDVYLTL